MKELHPDALQRGVFYVIIDIMITITKPYKDDMIIPISVNLFDEELKIDVYNEFLPLAHEYIKKFEGRYFSEEALEFLDKNIDVEGYARYDDALEYYIVFEGTNAKTSDIETVDIEIAEYITDETEFEADIIKEQGQPASLIVKEGRIAAISAANFFIEDDDKEVELAVETLPEFRGKGYAKAVLCDMARKVIELGKIPTYRVSCFNKPSIATALSSGFKEIGKEYYYNCYKEEE